MEMKLIHRWCLCNWRRYDRYCYGGVETEAALEFSGNGYSGVVQISDNSGGSSGERLELGLEIHNWRQWWRHGVMETF